MSLSVRRGSWVELGERAYAIRHRVFVKEQGVPEALEHDDEDAGALHILLLDEDVPVATGRLLPDGHVGRIAVLEEKRGRGHGRAIVRLLIDEARGRGYREVVLHAQTHAEGFYTALGFIRRGDVFMEAGIAHIAMAMCLES